MAFYYLQINLYHNELYRVSTTNLQVQAQMLQQYIPKMA